MTSLASQRAKKRYYERNVQKVKERAARWNREHPEVTRKAAQGYYERNRDEINAAARERIRNEPEKFAARWAVRNAVRSGRLVRGACEQLGPDCRGRIEAHHEDYSKPLEVRWLCSAHHGISHRTKEVL